MKEKENVEVDFQDLMHQQELIEKKHNEMIQQIEKEKMDLKIHSEVSIRSLLEACIKTSEKITMRAITECEASACGTSTYFIMIAEELQDVLTKLNIVHENYLKDNENNMEALVRKVQSSGHLLASIHEQGMTICNKSTNIESGESKLKVYFHLQKNNKFSNLFLFFSICMLKHFLFLLWYLNTKNTNFEEIVKKHFLIQNISVF